MSSEPGSNQALVGGERFNTSNDTGFSQPAIADFLEEMRRRWIALNETAKILVVFAFSTTLYMLLRINPISFISDYTRVVPGFVSFVLIPGILWSNIVFPKERRKLWSTIIFGLLFNCFVIQAVFLTRLFLSIPANVLLSMVIANSAIVVLFTLFTYTGLLSLDWRSSVSHNGGESLIAILFVGLILRFALLLLGSNSIAPDASLYADCARALMNGKFTTNVLVDNRIYELWNGVQYWFHEGFIFLLAISWILMEPVRSGPNLVLVISGLSLVLLSHDLTEHIFGKRAAIWIAGIISIHPLFLFHSVVAYGPEITSLLFLLGGVTLAVKTHNQSTSGMLVSGAMIGFADIIWSPNYFLFTLALPFFFLISGLTGRKESAALAIGTLLIGGARVFFLNSQIFMFILLALFGILLTITVLPAEWKIGRMRYYIVGIIGTILLWRFPIQIDQSSDFLTGLSYHFNGISNQMQLPNPPISIFQKSVSPEVIQRSLSFLVFHTTPIILVFAFVAVAISRNRRSVAALLSMALIGLIGTIFVLNSLAGFKEVMTVNYIFSDSRFFVSIVTLIIISAGGLFQEVWGKPISTSNWLSKFRNISRSEKGKIVAVILITAGMAPGYFAIPTGLELVNYEQRYGWTNLKPLVEQTTSSESTVIVDRTTEFSWLTNRKSAKMPSCGSRSFVRALSIIREYAQGYDAEYFLLDSYSVVSRKKLGPLMSDTLRVGNFIPSSFDLRPEGASQNTTGEIPTVKLIGQAGLESNRDFARLYTFVEQSFLRSYEIELLDSGWSASHGGLIENVSGNARLVIGSEGEYTNSWRPGGYDLNLSVENGYLLLRVGDTTANLARISIWTTDGELIGYAQDIGNRYYCLPLGECVIGDVRVVIEGNATDYITINSLYVWEAN